MHACLTVGVGTTCVLVNLRPHARFVLFCQCITIHWLFLCFSVYSVCNGCCEMVLCLVWWRVNYRFLWALAPNNHYSTHKHTARYQQTPHVYIYEAFDPVIDCFLINQFKIVQTTNKYIICIYILPTVLAGIWAVWLPYHLYITIQTTIS